MCFYHATDTFRVNLRSEGSLVSRNSWLKQVQYLKIMWLQQDSNPQPHLVCKQTLNHLAKLVEWSFDNCLWVSVLLQSLNTVFTLYQMVFIMLWKTYQIGFLFKWKQRFVSWFSFQRAIITQSSKIVILFIR